MKVDDPKFRSFIEGPCPLPAKPSRKPLIECIEERAIDIPYELMSDFKH